MIDRAAGHSVGSPFAFRAMTVQATRACCRRCASSSRAKAGEDDAWAQKAEGVYHRICDS